MAISDPSEALNAQLARFAEFGVTHLTGTPSHWRKVLTISRRPPSLTPAYVRLSGEIADQPVLDGLKATFPEAVIVHAYASTEAGVVFEVHDGLEGFPERFVAADGPVEVKVEDGSLRSASRGQQGLRRRGRSP